jgi:wobble nucleotide-excising tRNase
MFLRFETINKVGLFKDYSHAPGCEVGEATLIYGENGVGKSTLGAILDSLRESNPAEILRRTTLPGDVAPEVSLTLGSATYKFDGANWDARPPHDTLEVFFPGFVSRNVHAVTAVESEHRRSLCEFVLGREAVKQVARLAEADGESRAALAGRKAVEEQLKLVIKEPDTIESFSALAHDPDIQEKVEQARAELAQAKAREGVLLRAVPEPAELPPLDSDAIRALLQMTSEDIGTGVGELLRHHIESRLDEEGERWLEYGAMHADEGKCPYCAQDLEPSELANAIRAYFSAGYREYIERLRTETARLRTAFDQSAFQSAQMRFVAQILAAGKWVQEFSVDQEGMSRTVQTAGEAWNRGAAALNNLFQRKVNDPLTAIDTEAAHRATTGYAEAIALLHEVNNQLSSYSRAARELKTTLSTADTDQLQRRVQQLENQQLRFEPLAQDLLAQRHAQTVARSKLDTEKKNLKQLIDLEASRVVGKYQKAINHYLQFFGCDITIESFEPKFPSGKASVLYKLKAHGHEVPLGLSPDAPCFETVLSEGDKYVLALSFFFARLKHQQDLTGRIIVLDDPVNSLGSARRSLIYAVIRELYKRGAQIIVLTHDDRLAALMWRDKTLKKLVTLQVERIGGGSRIQAWDAEQAMQSAYVKNYLTLADFLDKGGDHQAVAGHIRPYVEQRLRHLHPGSSFHSRDSLGQMISKIRDSAPSSRLYGLQVKLSELEAINEAGLPSHHATDDVPGLEPLSPEEVRIFATKAVNVLA